MVLESLTNPLTAEKRPYEMFFVGLLYASVALFLALWIFKDEASLVMVFLIVVASLPLIHNTLRYEEKKDMTIHNEGTLLKEHSKALSYFIFLFLGFLVALSILYVFLPTNIVQLSFETQVKTINAINARITGMGISNTLFIQILSNNIKVLLFSILFSFFYGAGAIFILAWNASVIAVAIGNFVRNNIGSYAASIGLVKVGGYFHIFSVGLFRYMIHGVPEILGYFIGALAGGIISVAVSKHDLNTKEFKHIVLDSVDLILLALLVLVIAALIEVYITPALF